MEAPALGEELRENVNGDVPEIDGVTDVPEAPELRTSELVEYERPDGAVTVLLTLIVNAPLNV